MNNFLRSPFSRTLLALSIASATTVSQAGSFGLIEQSASGQGSAYAGAAAIGEDASTIYFNPAGMTRLSGQQIIVAGHIISPNADFTNNGSTTFAGTPLQGANSSTGDPAFIPNFYYSAELPNEIYVGVGVNVPFGLATEYSDGWVGRYHALNSEITSINVNPSIAWKATDKVSVGFGISIQYIDLELTNNIDSMAACLNLEAGFGVPGSPCAGYTIPGNAAQDSSTKLDGDSTEFGWNTGLLFDIDDKNRIGVAYRSAIKHNVSGNASYNLDAGGLQQLAAGLSSPPPTGSGFNILQNTTLEATAELPETFSLSYVGEVDDKWTALFDWTWTGWSSIDTITIRQAGGVPGLEPTLDLAYQNTNRFSVGVNYQHTDKLIYRGGLALDQTPIRSAESTSARIPGNDRTWLSLGAGYAPSTSWSFDVAYSHLFVSDTEINNTGSTTSGATLTGSYESSVDILSAQANFYF
ncbi:MAG: OmpP1/FadL family transporter [Gammaproteobacteria bacterium]|nr:OmpP1/FadL family transporter [Gammaproteobacteria bacterium]